ncbi:hypothetical protein OQA88_1241 [Cercophora sp. LCS_1]
MRVSSLLISAVMLSATSAAPLSDDCSADDRFTVARFVSWITDCGEQRGHTMGMSLVYRRYAGLCFPLNNDIRGLELTEIADGCRITAYRSPVCDDYPWNGVWRNETGCLWAGNSEFHSYKLTCDE